MTDFTKELNNRYPTTEEVEQMMARARTLRARAWRDAFVSIRRKLQEAVTPKRPASKTRHA